METSSALKIGITCYPLIGGSGILATALGSELARRGHEVHFFSSAKPVRLDLAQPRIFFHEVVVNEYSLFKYPDYTLPLAVKMARIAREKQLEFSRALRRATRDGSVSRGANAHQPRNKGA